MITHWTLHVGWWCCLWSDARVTEVSAPFDLVIGSSSLMRVLARDASGILVTRALETSSARIAVDSLEFQVQFEDGSVLARDACSGCEVVEHDESSVLWIRYWFESGSLLIEHQVENQTLRKRMRWEPVQEDVRRPVAYVVDDLDAAQWRVEGGLARHQSGVAAAIPDLAGSMVIGERIQWTSHVGVHAETETCAGVESFPWCEPIGFTIVGAEEGSIADLVDASPDPQARSLIIRSRTQDADVFDLGAALAPGGDSASGKQKDLRLDLRSKVELGSAGGPSLLDLRDADSFKQLTRRFMEVARQHAPAQLQFEIDAARDLDPARAVAVREWLGIARRIAPSLDVKVVMHGVTAPEACPLGWLRVADRFEIEAQNPTPAHRPAHRALQAGRMLHTLCVSGLAERGHEVPRVQWVERQTPEGFRSTAEDSRPSLRADAFDDLVFDLARGYPELDASRAPEGTVDDATLQQFAAWREQRKEHLRSVEACGGDPARGEVHGFLAGSEAQLILVLCNPSLFPVPFRLPASSSRWVRTYPYTELLSVTEGATAPKVELTGLEVACFETLEAMEWMGLIPEAVPFHFDAVERARCKISLYLANGEMREIAWFDAGARQAAGSTRIGLAPLPGQRRAGDSSRLQCSVSSSAKSFQISIPHVPKFRDESWTVDVWVEGKGADALEESHFEIDGATSRATSRGLGWILCSIGFEGRETPQRNDVVGALRRRLALNDVRCKVDVSALKDGAAGLRFSATLTHRRRLEPVCVERATPLKLFRRSQFLPYPEPPSAIEVEVLARRRPLPSSAESPSPATTLTPPADATQPDDAHQDSAAEQSALEPHDP